MAGVVLAVMACSSAPNEDQIATALASNNEAVQMAAVALTTDEQNVMDLGENALVLFYPCPGTVFNYNVQQWHVSYVLLHIPENLEDVSMRVVNGGVETGLGVTGVINGTEEGGRILDEALSNPQMVKQIDKQENFETRCN